MSVLKLGLLGLISVFIGFSFSSFAQMPPLAPTDKKEPEKEIIYKEKYDGYKYKVVPQSPSLSASSASKEDCNPKEPKKEPVPKPKPQPKPKPKPQPCNPCPCPACPKAEVVEKRETVYKLHEISLLAGMGADGMKVSEQTEGKQVDKYYGLVLGARYTYRFDPSWSVSVEGLTNNTGMLGVGFSFGSTRIKE